MAQDCRTQHALEQDTELVVHLTICSLSDRCRARCRNVMARSLIAVSKPAPDWNGTAVVNREFVELKLSDFKGTPHTCTIYFLTYLSLHTHATGGRKCTINLILETTQPAGKYFVFFFYPLDL